MIFAIQKYPKSILEQFEICNELDICFEELTFDEHLAVAVSREYALSTFLTKSVFCFDGSETICNHELKILMKKNFALADELNDFIKYSDQGGLIVKWLNDFQQSQPKYEFDNQVGYKSLTLEYFWGCLIIYGCVWIPTFMVAIAEQIIYRKARDPHAAKFWIYAEMLIDADRHFLLNHYELC